MMDEYKIFCDKIIKEEIIPYLEIEISENENKKYIIDTIKNNILEDYMIEYKYGHFYYNNIKLVIYRRDNHGMDIRDIEEEFEDINLFDNIDHIYDKIRLYRSNI